MMLFVTPIRRVIFSLCLMCSFVVLGCVSIGSAQVNTRAQKDTIVLTAKARQDSSGLTPSDFLTQRLRQVEPAASAEPPEVEVAKKSKMQSASKALPSEAGFNLWLGAGQWNAVLSETDEEWRGCKDLREPDLPQCELIGRSRALAFAKLGSIEFAWTVFDDLNSMKKGSNALFFAELLAENRSFQLCSDLVRIGLENATTSEREELYALNVRCLRRAGSLSDARRAAQAATSELPESKKIILELAITQLSENNLTQGCELLGKLFTDKFLNVAVVYNWGQCLVRRKDSESALSVLMVGEREWPSEPGWLILSGEIARLDGHRDLARERGLEYLSGSHVDDELRIQAESLAEM